MSAAAILIMISPAIDEVVAMGQFLAGARREGNRSGAPSGLAGRWNSTAHMKAESAVFQWQRRMIPARILAGADLDNLPWNLLIVTALGIWLIAAPALLGATGAAATNNYLAGTLIVT